VVRAFSECLAKSFGSEETAGKWCSFVTGWFNYVKACLLNNRRCRSGCDLIRPSTPKSRPQELVNAQASRGVEAFKSGGYPYFSLELLFSHTNSPVWYYVEQFWRVSDSPPHGKDRISILGSHHAGKARKLSLFGR
jgi:hypothetical protein